MALVEQRDPRVPVVAACEAVGLGRATLYRRRRPPAPSTVYSHPRAPNRRRLSGEERQRILNTLHTPEFADQPPTEVYATLLGRGEYVGSVRTMYRVLADAGEVRERRNVRAAQVHPMPSHTATAPNQVWTWDITKLATAEKGRFLQLYVIIDLFSRFVVGWLLAARECKHLAAQLLGETIVRHGVKPGLIVHADRGSAMKSDTVAQLLAELGASRSFSRPRVSDDNAFSEALFKTLKYQPDYPVFFTSEQQARGWAEPFFGWHNDEHHHSGLALFTPADVFHGRVEQVATIRQRALDAAYAAHPERFPNGPPVVRRPPAAVSINPITPTEAAPEAEARDAIATDPTSMENVMNIVDAITRASAGGAEPCGSTASQLEGGPCRAEVDHAASSMAIAS